MSLISFIFSDLPESSEADGGEAGLFWIWILGLPNEYFTGLKIGEFSSALVFFISLIWVVIGGSLPLTNGWRPTF